MSWQQQYDIRKFSHNWFRNGLWPAWQQPITLTLQRLLLWTGFPRLPGDEIPGLFQDHFLQFSRALFFHIMPLADGDVYGKHGTWIGEVIWHDQHKAVSEYIHQEMCIDTCVRLVMMDSSIKIYRHGCKYIYIYITLSQNHTLESDVIQKRLKITTDPCLPMLFFNSNNLKIW